MKKWIFMLLVGVIGGIAFNAGGDIYSKVKEEFHPPKVGNL